MSLVNCDYCSARIDTDYDVEGEYDERDGLFRCSYCCAKRDGRYEPLIPYIREHIDSAMYMARHVDGTYRRNLAYDARAWNKLLVRELLRVKARENIYG